MTKIQELAQALVSFHEGHPHICVYRFIDHKLLREWQAISGEQFSAASP